MKITNINNLKEYKKDKITLDQFPCLTKTIFFSKLKISGVGKRNAAIFLSKK